MQRTSPFVGHRPKNPEHTVLYQVVSQHLESFRELTASTGNLPAFVEQEFDAFLKCGQLEHGFARCVCERCELTHLVPFSCKKRGFCPSCLGRRMSDLAIHLTEHVLPQVPVRHWVCTPPWSLRTRLGFDRKACGLFARAFADALRRSMQHRAKDALGLRSVRDAQVGAVTFIQRTDSALRLSPHLHVIQLDGVYVRGKQGQLKFHEMDAPSEDDVADVAIMTAQRVLRKLELREVGDEEPWAVDEPLLAHCYGASAQGRQAFGLQQGKPVVRRIEARRSVAAAGQRIAEAENFQVFCDQSIEANDTRARFALCRYLTRPPLANNRLTLLPGGRVCYRMKRTFRDGTSAVVLSPHDLIARLSAMVPPPRFHLVRYSGVLAPHSNARPEVVPSPVEDPPAQLLLSWLAPDEAPDSKPTSKPNRPKRTPWAKLLARIFKIDAETCPRCGASMRIIEFVTNPKRIKTFLGAPRAPPAKVVPKTDPLSLSSGPQLSLPLP